ncbi:hypothetical protein PVK06_013192 [Gossypium arboreum]|uniref:Uncharacterized protein n=1 Tax=Gossypium arboreum TaxID=29729 RepID=A0ABR0QEM6_GOSAR|nr:hypothetical protein PVK06_013192 [Gossypium arboreum]
MSDFSLFARASRVEIAEIGSVVLASQHAAKREFSYNGNPLPSELALTVGSQQLTVRCRGNRDEYRIDGEEWCRFVRSTKYESCGHSLCQRKG